MRQLKGYIDIPGEVMTRAREMRAQTPPASWEEVARVLKYGRFALRARLDPEFRERSRAASAEYRRQTAETLRIANEIRGNEQQSRVVRKPLYDPKRDGVREPASLTAAVFGDPWPGRADLMRRLG